MSDMKCPVCNVGYVHESVNHWCCDYEFCPSYDETDTETYDILIRTRKALDVATKCINWVIDTFQKGLEHEADVAGCCELSLEQITATLENQNGNC